ncbi:hypothetical protein [Flavobacterium branchiophilum]|uniref:Uncharacterized protein n=1 Tax=Flavobacterium branchiophilum TaxID=55197 RepID=A0A543G693_9FLAO|nr:hypothetical protein [Flavobacterium branchiophilum]TQM41585.1 hypothetical protein BC670_2570 [Flavobacterium branchiophilum]GEM55656.1 hypothetical protein FB1_18770 [Flavobacterium branchiophilum NBRC 15030 = ATCC 35035]
MRNYLKFVFAIFGITIATFSSLNANAKKIESGGSCKSYGTCGTTDSGQVINGQYSE